MSYLHAGGIDRPLLIIKGGTSVVPHDNWRGTFATGTLANGQRAECHDTVVTNCLWIMWPGWKTTASHAAEVSPSGQSDWWGGLVDGMRDASGRMYMRNRYYDPATGQFTQTDPIGVAGGLNSYGFADGDAVSHSDPYGLASEDCCANEMNPRQLAIEVNRAHNATAGEAAFGVAVLAATAAPGLATRAYSFLKGGGSAARAAAELESRAAEVHSALDPIAQTMRTTAAMSTRGGGRVLAAGGRDLAPAQRALLRAGEVAARQPGAHAEQTLLTHAAQNGLAPRAIAASRAICPSCAAAIQEAGGTLISATRAIWK